jgi:hypothetical protein
MEGDCEQILFTKIIAKVKNERRIPSESDHLTRMT